MTGVILIETDRDQGRREGATIAIVETIDAETIGETIGVTIGGEMIEVATEEATSHERVRKKKMPEHFS